ncbi:hypothetical protein [Fibrobacter sp.]|uniref:hypothetical protein n=1 Tax=Fibrobacter sp. TaxID=35828 RepID=UPI00388DE780
MTTFIQKHWKKIVLSLCALFWSGCSDDSTSKPSNEPVACELQQLCPAYGIIYNCDGVKTTSRPENAENCTQELPSCTKEYICEDGMVCKESSVDDIKKYDCKEGTFIMPTDKITATYSESEFNSRYYVKDKP